MVNGDNSNKNICSYDYSNIRLVMVLCIIL